MKYDDSTLGIWATETPATAPAPELHITIIINPRLNLAPATLTEVQAALDELSGDVATRALELAAVYGARATVRILDGCAPTAAAPAPAVAESLYALTYAPRIALQAPAGARQFLAAIAESASRRLALATRLAESDFGRRMNTHVVIDLTGLTVSDESIPDLTGLLEAMPDEAAIN